MALDRRQFIIGCSAGAALLGSSSLRLLAGPLGSRLMINDNGHTFVLLFLRGGMDGLAFLSPEENRYYQDARPSDLKIRESEGYVVQDGEGNGFRLHPKAAALNELYKSGDLAFIHACGLKHGTRSHFDAQELIEKGINANGDANDGWIARYLNETQPEGMIPGLSASSTMALSFNGTNHASSISNLKEYNLNEAIRFPQLIKTWYENQGYLTDTAGRTLETIEYIQSSVRKNIKGNIRDGYPRGWKVNQLSNSLATVAELIKLNAGVKVANIDYGGWDTHERQDNVFPSLVEGLSDGLMAFYNDIKEHHKNVTVLVMSEFGRRLRANKSNGTDHGHGNVMMVLGGKVKGGQFFGTWPGLHNEALNKGVDLDITTDYRQVYSEIMQQAMGYSNISELFPNYNPGSNLGFL